MEIDPLKEAAAKEAVACPRCSAPRTHVKTIKPDLFSTGGVVGRYCDECGLEFEQQVT